MQKHLCEVPIWNFEQQFSVRGTHFASNFHDQIDFNENIFKHHVFNNFTATNIFNIRLKSYEERSKFETEDDDLQ